MRRVETTSGRVLEVENKFLFWPNAGYHAKWISKHDPKVWAELTLVQNDGVEYKFHSSSGTRRAQAYQYDFLKNYLMDDSHDVKQDEGVA